MRTKFDFSPFRRASVGFDRLFELLENGSSLLSADSFPPFDVTRKGDDRYRITLAVAGFRQDELDITAQQNVLIVAGRRTDEAERRYVHRGIANHAFERRFALGDYVRVQGAELKDGLLAIDLVRDVPDAMKPHRIEIGAASIPAISDQRAANDGSERKAA